MATERFTLTSLASMDQGRIALAFEAALSRCNEDCKDRPGVKAARKVTITATLQPNMEGDDLDSVNVTFHISDNVPKRASKAYNMAAGRDGLVFNDVAPDNAKQGTLDSVLLPGEKVEFQQVKRAR